MKHCILPSLLEYSREGLISKLNLIKGDRQKFARLTGQDDEVLRLHLDLVMKHFARQRSVMQSLGLSEILSGLQSVLDGEKLELTVHCMAESEDYMDLWPVVRSLDFEMARWIFLVSEPLWPVWSADIRHPKLSWGVWYDLGQWEWKESWVSSHNLLMTVRAGVSGQELSAKETNYAQEQTGKFKNIRFIVDGGWSVPKLDVMSKNTQIVSYSDFWGRMAAKV